MLNKLKLRKINGKLFTPRYMVPDKEDIDMSRQIEEEIYCIICTSSNITERNCKVICNNCGYTRDCSDPYIKGE